MLIEMQRTRVRFDELGRRRELLSAELMKHRGEMKDISLGRIDVSYSAGMQRLKDLGERVQQINAELAPIDEERARLSMHLPGNRRVVISDKFDRR